MQNIDDQEVPLSQNIAYQLHQMAEQTNQNRQYISHKEKTSIVTSSLLPHDDLSAREDLKNSPAFTKSKGTRTNQMYLYFLGFWKCP